MLKHMSLLESFYSTSTLGRTVRTFDQLERSWHSHIPFCPSLWSQLWPYLLLHLGSLQLEYHMLTAHCQGFSTSHPSAPVEILKFTWYWASGTEDQDICLKKTVKQCPWLLGGTMNRLSTWLWKMKTVSAQCNCAKGGDASSSELSLVSLTVAHLFLVNGHLCIGITKSTETISNCHTLFCIFKGLKKYINLL